jgi:drug/metabolite transporter (DMT)-like permease
MTQQPGKNQRKAYFCAVVAALLWSTVASAFKLALGHLDFVELLLFSSLISTAILAFVLAATGTFSEVVRSTRRQWLASCALGLLNPFLYYLVLFRAYELLPAQLAQPINYTWALTLSLLSVPLLGQRLGPRDIVGLLLGYSGVVVVSTQGHVLEFRAADFPGVALALASTVIWAVYWIYSTRDTRAPVVCLFQSFVCGLIPTAAAYWTMSDRSLPSWPGLAGAAYVGVFEMSFTFVLWLLALRLSANTAKVSGLIFLSPCISLVFIHFVVGETIATSTIVGLLLILAGIGVQKGLSR